MKEVTSTPVVTSVTSIDLSQSEKDEIEALQKRFSTGDIGISAYVAEYPKAVRREHSRIWQGVMNALSSSAKK